METEDEADVEDVWDELHIINRDRRRSLYSVPLSEIETVAADGSSAIFLVSVDNN